MSVCDTVSFKGKCLLFSNSVLQSFHQEKRGKRKCYYVLQQLHAESFRIGRHGAG